MQSTINYIIIVTHTHIIKIFFVRNFHTKLWLYAVKKGNEYLDLKNTVMLTLETMQLSRSSGFSNKTFI